jgi:hypothetical protein
LHESYSVFKALLEGFVGCDRCVGGGALFGALGTVRREVGKEGARLEYGDVVVGKEGIG